MADWESMVLVGRVARPHGVRGQVVINPETDFVEERFRAGARLWTRVDGRDEELTITEARVQGRRPVVAFLGCASVEDAERLAGQELRIPEQELQPLPEGSYYLHQLRGCAVEDEDGRRIGDVERVDGGAGSALLAVNGPRGEVLVPLVREICLAIDVAARVIRVRLPEGLVELNEVAGRRRARRPRGVRGVPESADTPKT